MAKTEPPGRHHSSTGSPYELASSCSRRHLGARWLVRIAPGPFQTQVRRIIGAHVNAHFSKRLVSALRLLALRMSLSTWLPHQSGRRRSPAAKLRYVRNPWFIQAESEPPGRLPPAPGSQIRQSHSSPRNLSLARVRWCFRRLFAESHTIPFVLTESQALIW